MLFLRAWLKRLARTRYNLIRLHLSWKIIIWYSKLSSMSLNLFSFDIFWLNWLISCKSFSFRFEMMFMINRTLKIRWRTMRMIENYSYIKSSCSKELFNADWDVENSSSMNYEIDLMNCVEFLCKWLNNVLIMLMIARNLMFKSLSLWNDWRCENEYNNRWKFYWWRKMRSFLLNEKI
jgi:hypothetical protein